MSDYQRDKGDMHLLFWIICRICEYPRKKSAPDPITTLHNNTMFISFQEFIIKEDGPLGMCTLAMTMSHERLLQLLLRASILGCEILE